MRIALVQQSASADHAANLAKGMDAVRRAAKQGAQIIGFAELAFERFYPQKSTSGNPLSLAEPIPGPATEAFSELARELGLQLLSRTGLLHPR